MILRRNRQRKKSELIIIELKIFKINDLNFIYIK